MTLLRKCPRCGARMTGNMRFCGKCGCDLEKEESLFRPADAGEPDAPPRPTETARIFAPEPEERRFTDRRELWKRIAVTAAAAVILGAALWLIVRMNRPAAPAAVSAPAPTEAVHLIAPDSESLTAATPSPTPRPTGTPAPTAPPAATAPIPTGPVVNEAAGAAYVASTSVNILAQPDAASAVLATAYQGDKLTRTGILDGWTRVEFGGVEGFVANEYLTVTEPTPTPEPTPLPEDFEVDDLNDAVVVVSDTANLRAGPGTDFPIRANVPAGTELRRTGTISGWSQVEYGGARVYISEGLIQPKTAETPVPAEAAPAEAAPAATPDSSYAGGTITMYQNGNVRTGPGTEYDSLGIAVGGSTLESTGRVGDWYVVTFQGQTGYVRSDLAG